MVEQCIDFRGATAIWPLSTTLIQQLFESIVLGRILLSDLILGRQEPGLESDPIPGFVTQYPQEPVYLLGVLWGKCQQDRDGGFRFRLEQIDERIILLDLVHDVDNQPCPCVGVPILGCLSPVDRSRYVQEFFEVHRVPGVLLVAV